MQLYYLGLENGNDVEFNGELLASVSTTDDDDSLNYVSLTDKWILIKVYRTECNELFCHKTIHRRGFGEQTVYVGKTCANLNDIMDFLGYGKLECILFKKLERTI